MDLFFYNIADNSVTRFSITPANLPRRDFFIVSFKRPTNTCTVRRSKFCSFQLSGKFFIIVSSQLTRKTEILETSGADIRTCTYFISLWFRARELAWLSVHICSGLDACSRHKRAHEFTSYVTIIFLIFQKDMYCRLRRNKLRTWNITTDYWYWFAFNRYFVRFLFH